MFFRPKSAKDDYSENMLPQTRRQVYFDVFKLQFGKLVVCGLFLLVFALPVHLTAIMRNLYQFSILDGYSNGTIAIEDAYSALKSIKTITSLIDILGYVIFAVGFAGVARIIKKFAWEETVYIGNDFLKGVKQNIGQYIILALFCSVLLLACSYMTDPLSVGTGTPYYLGIVGAVLCAVIFMPIAGFMTVTIPVYCNSFTKNIRFALILYSKNFLKTLLACLICFSPFALQILLELLIPQYIFVSVIIRVIFTLTIPFIMLGWMLFAFNCLDKNINADNFPELVNKGVHLPQSKDEDCEINNKIITGV